MTLKLSLIRGLLCFSVEPHSLCSNVAVFKNNGNKRGAIVQYIGKALINFCSMELSSGESTVLERTFNKSYLERNIQHISDEN